MKKWMIGTMTALVVLMMATAACRKKVQPVDAKSLLRTGIDYDKAGNYAEAVRYYREAAMMGLSEAQNNLGVMYKDGQGVAQDYAEAVRWFKEAAEQGNVLAQSNLEWMYQSGSGVAQDYS